MKHNRYLVVTADDFGIGPATSNGILDLAAQGLVTTAVLLVNSPYAAQAVQAWRQAGRPLELGWHPCLTLDRPVLPAGRVPSLVGADGHFRPLGPLMAGLALGQVRLAEVEAEFRAQYNRFADLVGQGPTVVNAHHHVQVFPGIGTLLLELLGQRQPLPYVRCVVEPWVTLRRVPGARGKRLFLSLLGQEFARRQRQRGFPGNDWLAGITDPVCVADPAFLVRWLTNMPGRVVELTCHPGYTDRTLLGRDATPTDGQMERRARELELLRLPAFRQACREAGFTLAAPFELIRSQNRIKSHAA